MSGQIIHQTQIQLIICGVEWKKTIKNKYKNQAGTQRYYIINILEEIE